MFVAELLRSSNALAQSDEVSVEISKSESAGKMPPVVVPNTQNPTPSEALPAAELREERLGAANASELTGEVARAPKSFTLGGYVEAFYQWNFNHPSNGITNYRGFDNRHNTLTLSNAAIDTSWDFEDVIGRLTLQVGHTPSAYYSAEPSRPGASGANATSSELWKYIQQAYVGYHFDIGGGLLISAGVFLSPIGPEGIPVRDNWNWSRSNLFFGLPYYHAGVRASYTLSDQWVVTLACFNGWNSIVDGNEQKSVSTQFTYSVPNQLALSFLYFGGVERPDGAPEGRAWRHVFDTHGTWYVNPWLTLLAHVDSGFERNAFGTSSWVATALYARFRLLSQLFAAVRGDIFYEGVPSNEGGTASPIFWPVSWVTSGTATLDYRPHERASFRLEYRHDHAQGEMYFGGDVHGGGSAIVPFAPNRSSQDTVTLGATTWF